MYRFDEGWTLRAKDWPASSGRRVVAVLSPNPISLRRAGGLCEDRPGAAEYPPRPSRRSGIGMPIVRRLARWVSPSPPLHPPPPPQGRRPHEPSGATGRGGSYGGFQPRRVDWGENRGSGWNRWDRTSVTMIVGRFNLAFSLPFMGRGGRVSGRGGVRRGVSEVSYFPPRAALRFAVPPHEGEGEVCVSVKSPSTTACGGGPPPHRKAMGRRRMRAPACPPAAASVEQAASRLWRNW